jgi:hypothetical protein
MVEFKNGNIVVVNSSSYEGLELGKSYKIKSVSLYKILLWSDDLGCPTWIDKVFVISVNESRKKKLRNVLWSD